MENPGVERVSHGFYYQIIKGLHDILLNIKKHLLLFILCMVLGIVPFIYKYMARTDGYKASFTVVYDELSRKIYGDRLQKINYLIRKKAFGEVAKYLNVGFPVAKSLVKIEGKNILGDDLSKDMNTDHIPFVVNFVTTDSNDILALQNGIVSFLENGNEFLVNRQKIKVAEIGKEVAFIDAQLNMMDSLKRLNSLGLLVQNIKKDDNSPLSIFEFSYDLYKKKQELLKKQAMPANIYIVDDAIVSEETNGSLLVVLLFGSILGFVLYTIIACILIPALRFKE